MLGMVVGHNLLIIWTNHKELIEAGEFTMADTCSESERAVEYLVYSRGDIWRAVQPMLETFRQITQPNAVP